jgi:hypothetical protein
MLLGSALPLGMGPTRKQFLAAQASSILTVDFVHVNTMFAAANLRPVVIEHGTRVHQSGIIADRDCTIRATPHGKSRCR